MRVASCAVQCGASEQLKVLIEGESLVNDGSASVVFFLMQVSAQASAVCAVEQADARPCEQLSRSCGFQNQAESLQAWVEGKSQSAGEAVRISVQLSVGGAAWGLAVGMAATLWLRFMFESIHAEITLTVRLSSLQLPCSV